MLRRWWQQKIPAMFNAIPSEWLPGFSREAAE